jgi:hypothetical protein
VELKVTVVVEHGGETSSPRSGLSPEAAAQAVRDLDGSRDVTVTISPEGLDERLLVGVDGSRAFIGLERPDGLFQFVTRNHDQQGARRPFMIGGQESEIESRYLPELRTAAIVIEEWLEGGEASTQGHWERQ